ncbi:hypothetical protein M378DRAFT_82481 [Amanita muscaria Koide BX008]|uniref:Uncharacterized protein n=1 Tax=Amanita muscaria (strain Koide BX008) TaxID=946122 RepID=A0A0C2T4M6_AMAMK|nr:hypothetical protein M378DRAFT_82481 [Amanita muscaria Koide BX008]
MEDYSTNSNHVKTADFIKPLEWDWEYELADRKNETKMDTALHGSVPFHVDRKVLKDVVREKMGVEVGKITFLSSGTFHKAYLVTLVSRSELVARVARRFMPRLKTGSEVATMAYLRENTNAPVPVVYHYDSNPYNRLGGEYILMSKASGIPLAKVFHTLSYNELVKLCTNLASLIIPLFSHRFPQIGSLYFGQNPRFDDASSVTTPRPIERSYIPLSLEQPQRVPRQTEFHIGPIVSWPFFGSNRGELLHPTEINRGPWSSTRQYLASCAEREVKGVIRENEGRSAPHKLHLDPDEIRSSWHHQMKAVPGDESDDSDEWDLEESDEDDWDAGDVMYRDYRRTQRTTFLVAHLSQREAKVREEMARWANLMERLSKMIKEDCPEEFGLDLHDLNLENVFVDSHDPTKITGIIDFESTTTRPLWACAHLPAFLLSSPFTTRLFRQAVQKMAETPPTTNPKPGCKEIDLATLAKEWLYYEEHGVRLRLAHRFAEWDGWEEGLIDSMLGPEEMEDEWFQDWNASTSDGAGDVSPPFGTVNHTRGNGPSLPGLTSAMNEILVSVAPVGGANRRVLPVQSTTKVLPFVKEKDKEKMLNTTGDICGGRGGELGRRLEAWLTVGPPSAKRWAVVDGVDADHE